MIEAVLFDFDGVIRFYHEEDTSAVEDAFSLPRGTIGRAAYTADLLLRVTTGSLTRSEWVAAVGQVIGSADAAQAWGRRPATTCPDVLQIVSETRSRGIPAYLITNGTDNLTAELIELGIADVFDGVFNSSELHVAKPSIEIFQIAVDAIGTRPNRIAFVDDIEENVATARGLGIIGMRYTNVLELRKWLMILGVIGSG